MVILVLVLKIAPLFVVTWIWVFGEDICVLDVDSEDCASNGDKDVDDGDEDDDVDDEDDDDNDADEADDDNGCADDDDEDDDDGLDMDDGDINDTVCADLLAARFDEIGYSLFGLLVSVRSFSEISWLVWVTVTCLPIGVRV